MALDKIVVRLDDSIKRQFKAACASQGVTMENQVTELIQEFLKKISIKK